MTSLIEHFLQILGLLTIGFMVWSAVMRTRIGW